MELRSGRGRRLFIMGVAFQMLFPLVGRVEMPFVQGCADVDEHLYDLPLDKASWEAAKIRLAEMVQREDSVVYRTDDKDSSSRKREREEQEKEKRAWNMLNNVVIDKRHPPRRFSDPRSNDSMQ